jgi:crotonobetainyl-CoA:carnitine CoA-transferase CaiB-like acyl-CoA transferase
MLLADLGADVLKVEPAAGDVTRGLGPYMPDDESREYGGYFQSINRGKRSLVLDLKSSAGADQLRALVVEADVLVENFSLGVMDRLGLSYESLHALNPRLVYASLRGYGDPRLGESPYASWPAMDIAIQAQAGAMGITGLADGTPVKIGPGIGDIFPGSLLSVGILAALIHARATGEGQLVDVAMYDSILALCERIVYQNSYTGVVPKPEGNGHPFWSPFDVLRAEDGWVAIAAPTTPRWRNLTEAMGRPELAEDPRFNTPVRRAEHSAEVRQIVEEWTVRHTRAELMSLLGGRVPIGPVNTVVDILADPHVSARGMVVEVEQPGAPRAAAIVGSPIKFSATPSAVRGRSPKLNEHGAAVSDGQHWLDQ